jgi:hypothetical protein
MCQFLEFAHVTGRRIKEELSWLKLVFAASVAIDVSLVGWLAENYQVAAQLLVVSAFVGVIFITLAVVWINRAAMRHFRSLEDE